MKFLHGAVFYDLAFYLNFGGICYQFFVEKGEFQVVVLNQSIRTNLYCTVRSKQLWGIVVLHHYMNVTELISKFDLPMWPSGQCTRPPCAVECDALSGRGSRLSPGASAYQRINYNNSYAHDEQGVNPGQVRMFYGVLCKLWPLLILWLIASMCQPRWRESQSRQMWLGAKEVSVRWPGAE